MAATLPAFQLASELGPSPSREEDLEDLCSRQAEQLERLQGLATEPRGAVKLPAGTIIIRSEEKQALIQVISDLGKRVEDLERLTARRDKEIEDLHKALKEAQQDIVWIQETFPPQIAEGLRRLKALEEGPDLSDNATVQRHITALYDHMDAIGRKQVSFLEASRCLKLSKSRILQFKAVIALDARFIIVQSESHKQKELIRLRKYFEGN